MRDLMPRRPTFFRSAWPAMPTTRTPKSSGAMITLMRRRKIVPRSCKLTAIEGASLPNSAPARRPTKIQVVSERRDVAYAATRRIASQRRSVGTSAGSGSIWAPARSDAAIAMVAATTAAARRFFFIGAWRRIPSVPKGMLVRAACQWRGPGQKKHPLIHTQRDERINACGAPRGKVASHERDAHQQQRDARIGEGIAGAHAVQQARRQASNRQRHQYPHNRANTRQEHALFEHQPHHLTRLRAQRHAQSDFTRSLRHRIRQHAINSNRREDQREGTKQAEQRRTHARGPQPLPQNLLHGLAIGERQIFVQLLHLRAHGAEQRFRIARGAYDERGEGRVLLPHGKVRHRLGIFPDLAHDGGPHDAHNLEQVWSNDDSEALSERFLARPHELGHGFVDDDHGRGVFAVEVREIAAAQKGNAHGPKVAGSHIVKTYKGSAVIGIGLFSFAKDGGQYTASKHAVRRYGGIHDAGNRLGAFDDIAEELLPMIGVITQGAQVKKHLKQIPRLEARIVLLRVLHAAKKQARSDERDQRQRNFRNHQQAAQTIVGPAQRSATPADLQNLVDVRAGGLDGRDDAEDQAGQKRDGDRKSKHAGIEREIDRTVEKKRRPEGPQDFASPEGYQQPGQSAEQRKHGAFGQKLPDQAGAPRAHRRANAQFFFAFGGLREQQIGQVDAGDQQHQADHAHQHAAGERKLPPLIDPQRRFVQRKEFHGAALVVARILFLEAGGDGLHGRARLGNADLRLQAADDREPTEAPVILEILELAGKHVVAHADGNPEHVRAAERHDSFEIWRRDTQDRVRRAIQGNGPADQPDVGTESPDPQAVTQYHFRVAA